MSSYIFSAFVAVGFLAMVECVNNYNGGLDMGGVGMRGRGMGGYGMGGPGMGGYGMGGSGMGYGMGGRGMGGCGMGGYGMGGRDCGGMGFQGGREEYDQFYGANNYGQAGLLATEDMGAQSSEGAYMDLMDNYFANDFSENANCFEECEDVSKKSKGCSSSKSGSVVDSNKALTTSEYDNQSMNENRLRDESELQQNNVQDCDSMAVLQDLEYRGGCETAGVGHRF